MDWSKGYSATYYMEQVDPATWRDIGLIRLTGGSIKREPTGKRESADVACKGVDVGIEMWVRIYLDVEQGGASAHVPLFTGLATTPDHDFDGNVKSNTLQCYSVLKACEDISLPLGWYAPAGASGGGVIRGLLGATPAPVVIADDAPFLSEAIIAESNENNLTMIDRILTAIDWRLRITGDGTIYVGPKPVEPVLTLDPIGNDMIENQVKVSADYYSCPNVYRATSGDMTGIARDENPDSPLSIVNRGREVWRTESGVALSNNESIALYAQRMLRQAQQVRKTSTYTRRYHPDLLPGDLVRMDYPIQGLQGVFEIQSQTVTLGYGGSTSEQIASRS